MAQRDLRRTKAVGGPRGTYPTGVTDLLVTGLQDIVRGTHPRESGSTKEYSEVPLPKTLLMVPQLHWKGTLRHFVGVVSATNTTVEPADRSQPHPPYDVSARGGEGGCGRLRSNGPRRVSIPTPSTRGGHVSQVYRRNLTETCLLDRGQGVNQYVSQCMKPKIRYSQTLDIVF